MPASLQQVGDGSLDRGRQFWQLIVLTLRPTIFDGYIVAFDIADVLQSFSERGREVRTRLGRSLVEEPDYGHYRLLRARRERPRCSRPAKQRDELAPSHVGHRASSPLARRSVCRTVNLPQRCRQVLGLDLNCSESRWGAADPVLMPKR